MGFYLTVAVLAGAIALSGATVFASDRATSGPVYADGPCKNLHKDECEYFQREKQKRAAQQEAEELKRQQAREEEAAYQKAKQEAREKKQAEWAADSAKRKTEDDARQAEYKRQSEADDRRYAAAEKKAATEASARKEKCGDDYKKPRIGMTMDRVRQCVSMSFKEYGQTNTDQGIVTTYRAPGGYLHVIDGKVVQWGKF